MASWKPNGITKLQAGFNLHTDQTIDWRLALTKAQMDLVGDPAYADVPIIDPTDPNQKLANPEAIYRADVWPEHYFSIC